MERSTLERPSWLRVKAPSTEGFKNLQAILNNERLHTVCSSASCPNMGECWERGTATFMILGNYCTRACRFCHIKTAKKGEPVDLDEPNRLVKSIGLMKLKHVVITSVARDDLKDEGAEQFARCIRAIKNNFAHVSIEILVPDFSANKNLIELVIKEQPNIFNHNIETVDRLTPKVRSKAKYIRSLEVLKIAKNINKNILTKSGIMLGLGETLEEVKQTLRDLREHYCDHLTIGQYLRPSSWHAKLARYASLEEFYDLEQYAKSIGFSHVKSGPLVRSSYHAEEGILNK